MELTLPIVPLEPPVLIVRRVGEQFSKAPQVVILPGLPRKIHLGNIVCTRELHVLPQARQKPQDQGKRHRDRAYEGDLVSAKSFLEPISGGRWSRLDRFAVQVPFQVGGQTARVLVAAGPVLFEALHYDPIQVTPNLVHQARGIYAATARGAGPVVIAQLGESG